MKDSSIYNKQFLLTTNDSFSLPWREETISGLKLYCHPELEYERSASSLRDLILLGFVFDYRKPESTNKEILDNLALSESFYQFLKSLSELSGHFVIIYHSDEMFCLINDAGAQREVFYDTAFTTLGSQPRLLGELLQLEEAAPGAREFYTSQMFLARKEFIAETTHAGNIRHLLPNHYIDLRQKSVVRYFPSEKIDHIKPEDAAETAIEMLKGFIKAASLRYKLYTGVTGGYDSRVLFLASLGIECTYYVARLSDMEESHYDLVIPKRLTGLFGKDLHVLTGNSSSGEEYKRLNTDVDFARPESKPFRGTGNFILINGNVSEIARNYYNYYTNLNGKKLAVLNGYPGVRFVATEYDKWFKSSHSIFSECGYNDLDMFYWEERMGNWAAKAKTEMNAYGTIVYSPFCSHKLLMTLLSTPRKLRDEHSNKLYNLIFMRLYPDAAKIPVNPSRRKKIIIVLKKTGLFTILQNLRLRYKLIKYR